MLFPETTSWTCAPTCSGRHGSVPQATRQESSGRALAPHGPSSPPLSPPYATFRPGVQRREKPVPIPAAERSPAAANSRSGRVREPTSRRPRPPAADRRALPPCGWGPLAAGRSPRRLPGRPICPRGPSPPAARARPPGGRRQRRDPGATDSLTALSWGGGPAGRRGGAQAAERASFPLPNRRPRRHRRTAALANQNVREVVLEARPCPRVRGAPGNAVAPWQPPAGGKREKQGAAHSPGAAGVPPAEAAGPPQG